MIDEGPVLAVGAISGTSMDGIDVALVETDGRDAVTPLGGATEPYEAGLRADLLALLADPARAAREPLAEIEARVTAAHAGAVRRFLEQRGLEPSAVRVAGLHGQTIYHRPEQRFTRQLLDGKQAAEAIGTDVVYRFRHADVAAGGQGAPLVPLYHAALTAGLERPLMVLNWGGVGNVTYVGEDTLLAFDTGPASALIDDFVRRRRGLAYDEGGALAASGRQHCAILERLMDNRFFAAPPPKSLDRNDFHARAAIVEELSDEDGAATLAAFTVQATAAALRYVPKPPLRWLVCGGGRLNRTLMQGLAASVGVPVEPVEAVGWAGDFIEAECFAYLAVRSLRGLPLSLPGTTGVPRPMPGGEHVAFAPRAA